MSNIILKIDRETEKKVESKFYFKDIDAFSDRYAVNKVDLITDVTAVKAAIRNIFMWNVGEEILYPNFGNNIRKYLYQPLDETSKAELAQEIQRCVEDNEKRVKIESVGIEQSDEDSEHSTIRFALIYTVIGDKSGKTRITDKVTVSEVNGKTNTTFEA